MHDQLLGSKQPVLSITLEPGESIVAGSGEFSWMTDSIQMSAGTNAEAQLSTALLRTLSESSMQLSAYTAKQEAGTIAFASRLPGSILGIEVGPASAYLVHGRGFLAGTPGIEVTTGYRQPSCAGDAAAEDFTLQRIGGHGRAWVELTGDVVRRELPAGTSLRTNPWHIGMFEASVALQMAELHGVSTIQAGNEVSRFAVLSGPGAVWLQAIPLLAASYRDLVPSGSAAPPALEGGAGSVQRAPATSTRQPPSRSDSGSRLGT